MTRLDKVVLDSAGMEAMLKSAPVARAVRSIAETAAESVRSSPTVQERGISDQVRIDDYETDRAASAVWLIHPAASAMQAKHGIFSKAAADAGVEYRERQG